MHELPACLAALALSGCAAVKSGASSAYGALLPDEFYLEAAESPFRAGADETLYCAGLSWALAPREVVLVEERPNAWDVTETAWFQAATGSEPVQASVLPSDGIQITTDAEGNRSVIVPSAVILAVLAAAGVAAETARRKFFRSTPGDGAGRPDTETP